jgi:hypothetical protein
MLALNSVVMALEPRAKHVMMAMLMMVMDAVLLVVYKSLFTALILVVLII